MMRQLPAQKAIDNLVSRWQTLNQPPHQIKTVITLLRLCHLLQLILTLKGTNGYHLILTIVISLLPTQKALAELALAAFLIMNTHDSFVMLIKFGNGPLV
jgi:hypothetical protein